MRTLIAFALISCLFATEIQAKDFKVKSWCPITHAAGVGRGATFDIALEAAIKACLANGGLAKCCYQYYRQI